MPLDDHGGNGHLALIYETREQQFAAVVPFIEQGLERGEQCLYITDGTGRTAVLDVLRTAGIAVDSALDDEQLVIRSVAETYQGSGGFDPDAMRAFYAEAIEDAVADHEGLRVAAEMTWLAEDDTAVADVMEYETDVNELIHDTAATGLCQYHHDRFPDEVIHDVLRTHPHIVYEQTVNQNVYYMPSLQEADQPGAYPSDHDLPVERMLERLLEISETLLECDEHEDFLREFARISSRPDRSIEETIRDFFRVGCDRFGYAHGVMARADPETGRFEVEYASGDHDYFTPGNMLPLTDTACRAAIESGTVAELPLTENGSRGVTVIEEFGVQASLGTYVEVDGASDRLLFFVPAQPRPDPVSNSERQFHAVVGRWVKAELEHRQQQQMVDDVLQFTQLVDEVWQALIAASTREEIEQSVCDRIATAPLYEAAWIGNRPVTGQHITPTAWEGITEEAVTAMTDAGAERDAVTAPLRAVETGDPAVLQATDDEPVAEYLRDQGMGSAMAIPIMFQDTCYGVLVVSAAQEDAFTDQYQSLLAACGRWIGFAITALERKEALITDEIVELEVRVREPDHFFFSVTEEVDVSFTLEDVIAQSNGSYLVYVAATGSSIEAVFDHADQDPDIDHARVVTDRDDEPLLEFVFAGPTVVETFAECGGTVTAATARDGVGTVTVELPQTADVRTVVETFQTTFPDSEVVAKRTRERAGTTAREFRQDLSDRLTEKQREVLRTALFAGYFERPRQTTGDDLADTLNISPSTFHQHLQVGLQKLLTAAFDTQTTE
ncbi:MEDS domain-containing protein [Natrinema sp. 1APR25-10V2]|uniref:MEDS domain-containing protein n=1 Tax=Natrinema sp. 1APR25-10V2 TaxID=2951081 RepID=UPI002876DAF4|nr:MEDS domain-containing protein [Natrinema sp. 1APR25-10V2]MDS0476895.1 MEDS domain-containing protein [Natrinema sp. 1APR25-10V2]